MADSISPQTSLDSVDPGYKWRVLVSVVFGLFMVVLDATVVNVALDTLQKHYSVTTDQAQWVISLYTLALGIATPLSGFLGDRLGVKRIYLAGLLLFVIGSTICGFAPNLMILIIARGIQGIGGGIALPLGSALLFSSFPPNERGAAFGVFGVVLVFAPAIGPLLGGWLVDHNLFSWIFFVNIPIGAIGIMIGLRFLRPYEGTERARIDIPGIVLSALGFGAVLFAASIAGEQGIGWGSPRVVVSLIVGFVALILFVIVEIRTEDPLLDIRLYAIPSFAIANVVSTVGTIALFGAEFLLPLYLQILRGENAFQTGLILLPMAISSGLISAIAGRISDLIGPRIPILVGFLLITYNTYQLSLLQIGTSVDFIIFLLVVRGIAVGLILQNSQLAALSDVPLARLNRATPLVQATRQTMQSIGVAVLATILTSAVTVSMPANLPGSGSIARLSPALQSKVYHAIQLFQSQYISGFQHAYYATFVIALLASLLSVFLPGWPGKKFKEARIARRSAAAKQEATASVVH